MDKLNTLGIIAKNLENELKALEETAEDKNEVLEDKLRAMQEEVTILEALKAKMR